MTLHIHPDCNLNPCFRLISSAVCAAFDDGFFTVQCSSLFQEWTRWNVRDVRDQHRCWCSWGAVVDAHFALLPGEAVSMVFLGSRVWSPVTLLSFLPFPRKHFDHQHHRTKNLLRSSHHFASLRYFKGIFNGHVLKLHVILTWKGNIQTTHCYLCLPELLLFMWTFAVFR